MLEVKVRSPKAQIVRLRVRGVDVQIKALMQSYGEEYPLHLTPGLTPLFIRCPRCGSHYIEAVLNIRIEVETT
jgi:hydrogenase nickel incorporation protein HypA/HybF